MATGANKLFGGNSDIAAQLASHSDISHADLRALWRRLYRAHPPKAIGRDLLELAVAWTLQEKALGGLSYATRRRLKEIARTLEADGDLAPNRTLRLKSGSQLIREWHGETHTVCVTEEGYEWRGERWRSLTAIASAITGTKWSGPRFFGLTAKAQAGEPSREAGNG